MNQQLIDVSGVMAQARATGLFVSRCTVQEPSETLTTAGVPVGTYSNVTGLVDIPCMAAPPAIDKAIAGVERRGVSQIQAEGFWHVLLDRYYASLVEGWRVGWRAVIDGIQYNIAAVDHDSQLQMTRISAERVTV